MSYFKPSKSHLLSIAALLALVGLGYAIHRSFVNSPRRMLQRAYQEQRVLDLRILNAQRADLRQNIKAEVPTFERPTILLEAEGRIATLLDRSSNDPSLLDEKGLVSLLSRSYDDAITYFQQALEIDSHSAEVLNDLASAYFERGESEQRFEDYGLAYELQSQALEIQPHNPVFLFNRAITSERLFLYQQCLDDWEQYLHLDASGNWATEAKTRLASARDHFDSHQRRVHVPLLSALAFSQKVDRSDESTWTEVEPRVEQYLERATSEWLTEAFPVEPIAPESQAAKDALATLAVILREHNHDLWLEDLIAESSKRNLGHAVASLSQAVIADNITEDFKLGKQKSIDASALFLRNGNRPGAIRAQFEEVYALHFSDSGNQCLNAISALEPEIGQRPYSWIKVQLRLEKKICLVDEDALGDSSEAAQTAAAAALRAHYPKLHLRALGFLGDAERLKGRRAAAWKLCEQALTEYWAESTDDVSGYNIYTLLDDLAEGEDLWHLDVAVDRQALDLGLSFRDPLTKAALFVRLGVAATKTENKTIAKESFASAEGLLGEAPQSSVTQNYRVGIEIDRSRLAAQTEGIESALNMLTGLNARLTLISNDSLLADYYRALGDAQRRARHLDIAITSLDAAVSIAEKRRASLKSDLDRSVWTRDSENSLSELVEVKLEAHDYTGALTTRERFRDEFGQNLARDRGTRKGRGSITPIDEVARLRASESGVSGTTTVVYSLLSDGLAIWAINNQGITYRKVAKNPQYIRMLSRRFMELCSTPLSSMTSIESTARQLHDVLIAPIEDQLRSNDKILIEPEASLEGVPFQALLSKDGRYLIEQHPIVYSVGFRGASNKPIDAPLNSALRVLAVANAFSFHGSRLPRLSEVTTEAEDVAKQFRESKLLENGNATFARISLDLPHVDILHFAGHSGTLSGHTGLVLATADGERETPAVLDLFLLERLRVSHLKLVVLSSCTTGKEDLGNENVPESLAQGFGRRGVPNVVATHWNLDSASGANLMRMFYRAMLSGKSVAQAMAVSEIEMRQTEPHPYFWAVYDVFGQQ